MRALRPGQDTVLSWPEGAIDCRVIAAAGGFVLLRPERIWRLVYDLPTGTCSLTFLDGMIPMGWDGNVEYGSEPGELRFRIAGNPESADRRSSVRLPVFADVTVTADGQTHDGQMLDVSAGGMRFRIQGKLDAGTLTHVRGRLPDGPLIDAHGVIRATEPGVCAMEFTALHDVTPQDIGSWTVQQLRHSLAGRG